MSQRKLRLGIDVGGTNTDAALMCGKDVVATGKSFTTSDVRSGVISVVTEILAQGGYRGSDIEAVMIGTTQFVNAFVQRSDLSPVAIFRVALPKADGVPPLAGWPDDAARAVGSHIYMVGGGAFYTGKDFAPLDREALRLAARDARQKGLEAVAVSAIFSPLRPDIEEEAAAVIQAEMPDARITLSSQVGGVGLVDRENATIINATLGALSVKVVRSLVQAFADLGIHVPIYISQNDGTLISTEMAERYPIMTCSAGPTNSIRGAAFLTGLDEAIVADIGGTTTDIGFLLRGFPRETTAANLIGGVRTNFRMPDTLSIGLGGGSIVRISDAGVSLGPDSVGYRLKELGRVFGGPTVTATDIAVRAGQARIGDAAALSDLPDSTVEAALSVIHTMIEDAIDQVKTSPHPLPLVLVGGGSILVSRPIKGASEVLRPAHAEVANAVGAAIALVSGRVDKMFDVDKLGREGALAQAKEEAVSAAVRAGAQAGAVEIIDISEMPMTHMRTGCVQMRVRAAGPLAALN
ncbi:hydantoinase/oxoprolinase family protein [Sphingosinicella microcystinivorans]|uniref:hydantoinase/oxoprolinase family protein n=1 Tax=Sphingosinicella microcystinivorans TaxID=335406 RepID=UPI0022F3C244|nr:hydantoinase/oxoprolinase family protein [Sphingosinicella microcystinivorans]WBX85602.1 hydantoinase/oxoprolinase family protein [Sphingosinicella microcystinivorans]